MRFQIDNLNCPKCGEPIWLYAAEGDGASDVLEPSELDGEGTMMPAQIETARYLHTWMECRLDCGWLWEGHEITADEMHERHVDRRKKYGV